MAIYTITITRDLTESIVMTVYAKSESVAEDMALETLALMESPAWTIDDGSGESESPYVSDCSLIECSEDEAMNAAQRHQAEQDEITNLCEAGICDHHLCPGNRPLNERMEELWQTSFLDGESANVTRALRHFEREHDDNRFPSNIEDLDDAIADLLADMRHLCDLTGRSFPGLLDRSERIHQADKFDHPAAADAELANMVRLQS